MRIAIVAMDTGGVVQSYAGPAVDLGRAGHDVRLLAPAEFAPPGGRPAWMWYRWAGVPRKGVVERRRGREEPVAALLQRLVGGTDLTVDPARRSWIPRSDGHTTPELGRKDP
jgi:hypothetical protein